MSRDVAPTSLSPLSSSPAPSPSPSQLASTRRSLLSRLTLPLRSRTRNLTDFHIRPLEPHRRYAPGDLVKGAIVLTVLKPVRVTHLTVCLHGFVRVFKRANDANDAPPAETGLAASRDRTKTQYFGNGHASLFQDETTLCGEGRLEPGIYEFNFEMEFPSKGLPTSIDFERGTISYMITATITRPTSIAATSSCEQKLALVETVDIALMRPPKPRTISLEPISKRSRIRRSGKNKEASLLEMLDTRSSYERPKGSMSPVPDESASQYGSAEGDINPQSPAPSDAVSTISTPTGTDSTVSSASQSTRYDPAPSSTKSARDSQRSSSSMDDKTITATIELLKSGILPGDNLPLKVSIKHTKGIKSLHGIIVTLYRQGRIDSSPPLSRFVDIEGKGGEKMKHEEYYPKSRTGLSGLSLSAAGSSSVFRKDLAQTFAPLIVDPTTLTTVVNTSIRVPEDSFPTISNVPGEMISFKYYVEVVVDLGGKLAVQQRHLSHTGSVALSSSFDSSGGRAVGPNTLATWGSSIIDTDHIRREKSVVACLFEVTVGSMDSSRRRRPGSARKHNHEFLEGSIPMPATIEGPIHEEPPDSNGVDGRHDEQYFHHYEQPHDETQYTGRYPSDGYAYQDYDNSYDGLYPPPAHADIPVPRPEIQDEEGFTEKERIRRAEERLLPSQPPQDAEGASTSAANAPAHDASAPPPPDEQEGDLYGSEDATPRGPSAPDGSLQHDGSSALTPIPSAPALKDLAPRLQPSDDKQELERQRMLAEASAPPDFQEEDNAGESSSGAPHEPSAPVLTEEDEWRGPFSHPAGGSSHGESLPKYER